MSIDSRVLAMELWPRLGFGKHADKSLGQVVFADPGWFYWAVEVEEIFPGYRGVAAAEVARRAHRIRIKDGHVADHVFDRQYRFSHLEIVAGASWPQSGYRLPHIDLGMARSYDKTGSKLLLEDMKQHVFGSRSYRLTRRRCLDFFVDSSNFVLED